MPDLLLLLFLFNLSLFLLHEMDAIRRSEWKLFLVLQDMDDAKAYKVFTFIHLPLYTIILALLFSQYQTITFWVLDIFFMIHAILHFFSKSTPATNLRIHSLVSSSIRWELLLLSIYY